MTGRIGDLAYFNHLMFSLRESRQRHDELVFQNTSGKKAREFSGIATQAAPLISLKNRFERTQRYITNINAVDTRLDVMENTINQLEKTVARFNADLVGALNNENAEPQGINIQAQSTLEQVANALNRKLDGRFLFAGSQVKRPPVDIDVPAFARPPELPAPANTSYYTGNNQVLQVRVDDSLVIDYGITASDPPFETLMRALNLTRSVDVGPPADRARLVAAKELVEDTISSLAGLRTKLGGVRAQLINARDIHEDFKLNLTERIGQIEAVEMTEAVARLSNERTAINASFRVIAQVSRLSILDFL